MKNVHGKNAFYRFNVYNFGEKPSKKERDSQDTLYEDILGVIHDLD